jgi:hypothetical protein
MVVRPVFLSALSIVKKVLAADYACTENDFDCEGVFIHQAKELPGRRRFPFREKTLNVATMGRGVVVSCSVERLGWADANLSQLSRNDIFAAPAIALMNEFIKKDNQSIADPVLANICTRDIFRPFSPPEDVKIEIIDDADRLGKYNNEARFPNSFSHPNNPNLVVAVAKYKGKTAGQAGATADTDILWQIGVDTLEPYRQRGIGKALVSVLTEYILGQQNIPYYSSRESNIASRALCASLGYKTAWVELYAREQKA